MSGVHLDFERPLVELEKKIEELRQSADAADVNVHREVAALEKRADEMRHQIFSRLTRYQRVQLARHPRRPYTLDYVRLMTTGWIELFGDRGFADDKALVGGFAWIDGRPLLVVGNQKGRDTKENLTRRFGMANPEGYRKALRLMELAGRFGVPSSPSSTPRAPIRGSAPRSADRPRPSRATCARWRRCRCPW